MVLDKAEYVDKVHEMLSDTTYEVLKKDQTTKHKQELVGILTCLKQEKKIDERQYEYFVPHAGKCSQDVLYTENLQGRNSSVTNSALHGINWVPHI